MAKAEQRSPFAPALAPLQELPTTTGCSAPALRVGTLALTVGAACSFSLHAFGVAEHRFSRSGKLRILAVTSPKRLIAAPELPTVAEGSFPGLTNQSTIGPVAPAGTSKPIIEQIARAVRTALAEPAYQQKLIDSGFEASPDTTPEKFRRRLEADVAFWTPVVEALGLKID